MLFSNTWSSATANAQDLNLEYPLPSHNVIMWPSCLSLHGHSCAVTFGIVFNPIATLENSPKFTQSFFVSKFLRLFASLTFAIGKPLGILKELLVLFLKITFNRPRTILLIDGIMNKSLSSRISSFPSTKTFELFKLFLGKDLNRGISSSITPKLWGCIVTSSTLITSSPSWSMQTEMFSSLSSFINWIKRSPSLSNPVDNLQALIMFMPRMTSFVFMTMNGTLSNFNFPPTVTSSRTPSHDVFLASGIIPSTVNFSFVLMSFIPAFSISLTKTSLITDDIAPVSTKACVFMSPS